MSPLPPSVSYFLLRECNAKCKFCFATFKDVNGRLSNQDAERVLTALAEAGVEKITFVGGEPTLHPHIKQLVTLSSELGMTTTIVTNGARLPQLLKAVGDKLDWVGLDLDSAIPGVEGKLGRGNGRYVSRLLEHVQMCRELGIKVKLNTVVTRLSWEEDMSDIIREIKPDRWKAFQVLPIKGQNDGKVEDLLLSDEQFAAWVARHEHLRAEGLAPVPETNEQMTKSYALVDPLGRFFSNDGVHEYGQAILDVGVETAWESIDFHQNRFEERGGLYEW